MLVYSLDSWRKLKLMESDQPGVAVQSITSRGLYLLGCTFALLLGLVTWCLRMVTDRSLLTLDQWLELPSLGLSFSVLDGFLAVPILLFLVHYFAIKQLAQASKQIVGRLTGLEEEEKSYLIAHGNLPFWAPILIYPSTHSLKAWLKRMALEGLVFFLPLVLFVSIQLRFSDYQSFDLTAYHALVLCLDAVLVFYFRPIIFQQIPTISDSHIAESVHINFNSRSFLVQNIKNGLLCWLRIPLFRFQKERFRISQLKKGIKQLPGLLLINLIFWGAIAQSCFNLFLVHQITGADFLSVEPWINENSPWIHLPVLEVTNQVLTEQAATGEEKAGFVSKSTLNLQGRYLRYSDLSYSKLTAAKLQGVHAEKCKLRETVLAQAQLDSANFSFADASGTDFSGSFVTHQPSKGKQLEFKYAFIIYSNLSEVYWPNVLLQGVHLFESNIQSAHLKGAQMQGAIIFLTNMMGANVSSVDLTGAMISESQLEGVNLNDAHLQGIELTKVSLAGACLNRVNLSKWKSSNLSGLDSAWINQVNYNWSENWKTIPLVKGKLTTSFRRRMNRAENRIQDTLNLSSNGVLPCLTARKALLKSESGHMKLENLMIIDTHSSQSHSSINAINLELLKFSYDHVKPKYLAFFKSNLYEENRKYFDSLIKQLNAH